MTTQVRNHFESPVHPKLRETEGIEIREDHLTGDTWINISGNWTRIVTMKNLWNIDGEWMNDQLIIKMRFGITTASGQNLTVFRDLIEVSDDLFYKANRISTMYLTTFPRA